MTLSEQPNMPHLNSSTDIEGFTAEATNLLARGVEPGSVSWSVDPSGFPGEHAAVMHAPDRLRSRPQPGVVPASFVRTTEYVVRHRADDRFALLYRVLWRLVYEPKLRHDRTDPDMIRLAHMAHAVRRDIHKHKLQARFITIAAPEVPGGSLRVAWCDPAHHILEPLAGWFARQDPKQPGLLLTPDGCACWNASRIAYAPGAQPGGSAPIDPAEWLALWRRSFANAPTDE